jgi:parallel beta-helix repeat protein
MLNLNKLPSLITASLLCVLILQLGLVLRFGVVNFDSAIAQTTRVVPDTYATIQEAIDAADPGDTIYVHSGTYNESISINKTISLVGENPETTIIDGSKPNETFSSVVYVFGEDAKDVRICNFTIRGSENAWGIYTVFHANAWIENNTIANNSGGILALFSDNNTFVNNTVKNNKYEGMLFIDSSENTMRNNTISGNTYNFGILRSPFNHSIDTSNLINGKPIYYLKNQSDLTIDPHNVGYLALVNCTNITVENLNLTSNYNGLLLAKTENSTLRNNTFTNNARGIDIINSSNNTIQGNNVTDSTWLGISLVNSPNSKFRENHLMGNWLSFEVSGDSLGDFMQDIDTSNTVDGKVTRYLTNYTDLLINPSTFDNTGYLALVNCYNVTAEDFSLENNEILVAFTQNSSIVENTITVGGISLTHSSFISLADNTIMNGESGISIQRSNNNTVAKNNIAQNREHGILLQNSSNNTISDNNVKNSTIGFRLSESSNNTILRNNIADNKQYGLNLWNSSYNKIFHNNFINNAVPQWQAVCSGGVGNNWDNGYPSGGNYWNDYNGTDIYSGTHPQTEPGSDGIGDASYGNIFSLIDHYPLMNSTQTFDIGIWEGKTCSVEVISNSTLSNFKLDEAARTLSFNVTGTEETVGFCRIIIPNVIVQNLWNGNYSVLINNESWPFRNWTDIENTYIYINYTHSEHEIIIMPELPKATILTIFIMIITFAIFATKKLGKPKVAKSKKKIGA